MKTYCTLALLLVLLAACHEPSPTTPPKLRFPALSTPLITSQTMYKAPDQRIKVW